MHERIDTYSSIEQAVEYYLNYRVTRRGSPPSTIVTYSSILKDFALFYPDLSVSLLSVRHIDDYADNLSNERKICLKTVKNKLACIRGFVRFLYIKELTDVRPEQVDIPVMRYEEAKHNSQQNFLTECEENQLLSACYDVRTRAILLTFLRSGLRVSELCNLLLEDVAERDIFVRCGKGGKNRMTFIDSDSKRALASYLDTRDDGSPYAFVSYLGDKLSRQYIARLVTQAAKQAGLKKRVTCHTLRHTFATRLLWRGMRMEDVQVIMGHTYARTTRIYLHYTSTYLRDRYDSFSKAEITPKY